MAHPRRVVTKPAILQRVRKLCLGLPETTEKEAWGGPTFRVRDKMIAMYVDDHHGDGRFALWIKSTPDAQEDLVALDPETFFIPPYVGPSGWIGMRLDRKPDWGVVEDLLLAGYRMVAPKRALALLEG